MFRRCADPFGLVFPFYRCVCVCVCARAAVSESAPPPSLLERVRAKELAAKQ